LGGGRTNEDGVRRKESVDINRGEPGKGHDTLVRQNFACGKGRRRGSSAMTAYLWLELKRGSQTNGKFLGGSLERETGAPMGEKSNNG